MSSALDPTKRVEPSPCDGAPSADAPLRDAGAARMARRAPGRSALLSRLVAAALAALLALSGCARPADVATEAASSAPAAGVEAAATDGADVEATVAQAFEKEPDGFAALADGASAVVDENGGAPTFTDEDAAYAARNLGFESYSELDELGRCGAATACLGPETMPAPNEKRESISEVKPTGWNQAYYDSVQGGALWNRCHLIAWSLADENANERNLVTGTRSMNAQAMLPYEEEVARYIDRTGNHVLYRATPVFEDRELVCRGVWLEAESLEDGGSGVSFSVLCLNAQPGIAIDYGTGASREKVAEPSDASEDEARDYVLNTASKRFHLPDCSSVSSISPGNRTEVNATRDELIDEGYRPCGSCQP